jgi:hypothetical protein
MPSQPLILFLNDFESASTSLSIVSMIFLEGYANSTSLWEVEFTVVPFKKVAVETKSIQSKPIISSNISTDIPQVECFTLHAAAVLCAGQPPKVVLRPAAQL